jgi:3-oxoacyl-[acyl-carrier-protein] synthase-3
LKAFITASGSCLPERVVSNEEIAALLGLSAEQIFDSSGIRYRRWVEPGTRTSTLAAHALRRALSAGQVHADAVDFLIMGTMTPDRLIPGSAPAIQKQAALPHIPCLDIRATCCNMLYGMEVARSLVRSHAARNVALCFADIQSAWLDMSHAAGTTSMLFGDGASAIVVSGADTKGSLEIVDILLRTDGSYVDDLGVRSPGTEFGSGVNGSWAVGADYLPRMNGTRVLMRASRSMAAACRALLQRNEVTEQEVAWIVPHQANAHVMKQVLRALGLWRHPERLVSVIEDYGNTSSASMGLALDHLRRSGRVKRGDYVLFPGFGAGFTWGAALCKAT